MKAVYLVVTADGAIDVFDNIRAAECQAWYVQRTLGVNAWILVREVKS